MYKRQDLINEDGKYHIDYEDFEKKIVENQVKIFILCSPHNPAGRVWKKEELKTLFEICRKHQVYVISDEIHHDLIFSEHPHVPSLSVGEYADMMVAITAPSKTFNLAGGQNSIAVSYTHLDVYKRQIGTCLAAALAGPVVGAISGAINNIIYGVTMDPISTVYALSLIHI